MKDLIRRAWRKIRCCVGLHRWVRVSGSAEWRSPAVPVPHRKRARRCLHCSARKGVRR